MCHRAAERIPPVSRAALADHAGGGEGVDRLLRVVDGGQRPAPSDTYPIPTTLLGQ